ncbi:MAG: hypothetical protein IPI54_12120 [Chitinophagaceae bacterium]|nr:hypothetical protein [Chitinophagaceae bacterium]
MDQLISLITILGVAIAIILIIVFRPRSNNDLMVLQNRISELQNSLLKIESNLKDDFRINREENAGIAKDNRQELANSLKDFILEQRSKFDELKEEQKELTAKTVEQLEKVTGKLEEKLQALLQQAGKDSGLVRESLLTAFKGFQESFDSNIRSFNDLQGRSSRCWIPDKMSW